MKPIIIVLSLIIIANFSYAEITENEILSQADKTVKKELIDNFNLGLNTKVQLEAYNSIVKSQFSPKGKIEIVSKFSDAYKKGLPADPLAEKVLEGFAKGANETQIVYALNKLEDRYIFSKDLVAQFNVSKGVKAKLMQNIVDALSAGASKGSIKNIVEQAKATKDIETLLEVTEFSRDMARARVKSEDIEKTISLALKNGYKAREISEVKNTFKENIKTKNSNQLADNIISGLKMGKKSSEVGKGYGRGNDKGRGSGGQEGGGSGNGNGGGGGGHGK